MFLIIEQHLLWSCKIDIVKKYDLFFLKYNYGRLSVAVRCLNILQSLLLLFWTTKADGFLPSIHVSRCLWRQSELLTHPKQRTVIDRWKPDTSIKSIKSTANMPRIPGQRPQNHSQLLCLIQDCHRICDFMNHDH